MEHIAPPEVARYRRGLIDQVVCNISSDAALQGGYERRNGTSVPRLQGNDVYTLSRGEAFAFTLDRLVRILKTIELGDAVLASSPEAVGEAKKQGPTCPSTRSRRSQRPGGESCESARALRVWDLHQAIQREAWESYGDYRAPWIDEGRGRPGARDGSAVRLPGGVLGCERPLAWSACVTFPS